MVVAKKKVVKKAKGKRSKAVVRKRRLPRALKTRLDAVDKVFDKTFQDWKKLTTELNSDFREIQGTMNFFVEGLPKDKCNEDLIILLNIIRKLIVEAHNRAETLQESMEKVASLKPCENMEAEIIGIIRELGKSRYDTYSDPIVRDMFKSLMPLFELANEEGFEFPDWYQYYVPKEDQL